MADLIQENPHSRHILTDPRVAELGIRLHSAGRLPAAACPDELVPAAPEMGALPPVPAKGPAHAELSRLHGEVEFLERHCRGPAVCVVTGARPRHRALFEGGELFDEMSFHFYGAGHCATELDKLLAEANSQRRPGRQHSVHQEPFGWEHAILYARMGLGGQRLLFLQTDRPPALVERRRAGVQDWMLETTGLVRTLATGREFAAALLAYKVNAAETSLAGPIRPPVFAPKDSAWVWVEVSARDAREPLVARDPRKLSSQLQYHLQIVRGCVFDCPAPADVELYVAGVPLDRCGDCCRYRRLLAALGKRTGRPMTELHAGLAGP